MNDQLARDTVEGTTTADCCFGCQSTEGVQMENSRTSYPWDGNGENPNAPVPLCRSCAADHHAYWDEMWAHVNGGY